MSPGLRPQRETCATISTGKTSSVTGGTHPAESARTGAWMMPCPIPLPYGLRTGAGLRAAINWTCLRQRKPDSMLRLEEHTSELQSLMRISYAVLCLQKKIEHQMSEHNTKDVNRI